MPSPKTNPVVKLLRQFQELSPEDMKTALALCQEVVKRFVVKEKTTKLGRPPKNTAKPLGGEPEKVA